MNIESNVFYNSYNGLALFGYAVGLNNVLLHVGKGRALALPDGDEIGPDSAIHTSGANVALIGNAVAYSHSGGIEMTSALRTPMLNNTIHHSHVGFALKGWASRNQPVQDVSYLCEAITRDVR